jgi:hypothetical protein
MTTTTAEVDINSNAQSSNLDILRMIGWDHMNEKQKSSTIDEARNLLANKPKTLLAANAKLKKRVEALYNTGIQSERKANILNGQAHSQVNTARNIMNLINEQEARIIQLTRAALILDAVYSNNRPD